MYNTKDKGSRMGASVSETTTRITTTTRSPYGAVVLILILLFGHTHPSGRGACAEAPHCHTVAKVCYLCPGSIF
jgi:hypothetical protein